jgi:hypothetical protein
MADRLNNPTGAEVGLAEFAPAPVDADFLRHVVKSTTSYSEGWRGVAARLLWVEAMLARKDAPAPALTMERGTAAEALYHELLFEVANKYPGESRHDTARRYIRERESSGRGGPASVSKDGLSPKDGSSSVSAVDEADHGRIDDI